MTDVAPALKREQLKHCVEAISDEIVHITMEILVLQEKLDELKWQRISLRSALHGD
jgi:hypothetical protein